MTANTETAMWQNSESTSITTRRMKMTRLKVHTLECYSGQTLCVSARALAKSVYDLLIDEYKLSEARIDAEKARNGGGQTSSERDGTDDKSSAPSDGFDEFVPASPGRAGADQKSDAKVLPAGCKVLMLFASGFRRCLVTGCWTHSGSNRFATATIVAAYNICQ